MAGVGATQEKTELEGNGTVFYVFSFLILTQSWAVRHHQVCFTIVETEALMAG